LLEDMLTEQGYQTFLASDGKVGVDLYKTNHGRIDAVILDMNMQEMHGKETYDKLSEINPDVKVLIATGDPESSDVLALSKNKHVRVISKPYSMNELYQALQLLA
ncbi:MAG: response regulator, partial [Chlorobiales bacterium]|nr:response regulator [Chlorobiales bacterium]